MHKKKFNNNDQVKFSKLSGDLNPIHLDQSYAANTLFQNIVVHGLNIVVWALEKTISSNIKYINRIKIEQNTIFLLIFKCKSIKKRFYIITCCSSGVHLALI